MPSEVLLLNADVAPVNWVPLSSISWQNAVRLMWLDVVDVLHVYEDRFVHSPSITIEVPAVVMLRRQVKGFRTWVANNEQPAAHLIFLRDNFQCQYCLQQFERHNLTIDHVLPKVYGGRTTYDNCSAACSSCNGKRGCNTKIQPANKPYIPTIGQLVRNMRKFPIFVPHPSWNLYLHWSPDLVRLGNINVDTSEDVSLEFCNS
jgi:5-methylcytosine-specific restriction endonuclease McrA